MAEESSEEDLQPFFYGLFPVCPLESLARQEKNFFRRISGTEDVVEEEVVKFIRPYDVFSLLGNLAVKVCRKKFRADRGVYDVQEYSSCLPDVPVFSFSIETVFGRPFYQMPYECFRNSGITAKNVSSFSKDIPNILESKNSKNSRE